MKTKAPTLDELETNLELAQAAWEREKVALALAHSLRELDDEAFDYLIASTQHELANIDENDPENADSLAVVMARSIQIETEKRTNVW